jgi:predicted aconitase with swiveling domain
MREPRALVEGEGEGVALVLDEPLSFWGGFDPATGRVIDVHHPQRGALLTDRVLIMPTGRGSSSSSYVVAEAIRTGTAPAAILLREADPILALGAIVARELYGRRVPVLELGDAYPRVARDADGRPFRVSASAAGTSFGSGDVDPRS